MSLLSLQTQPNTAKHSSKSISEGGRIWQVCNNHDNNNNNNDNDNHNHNNHDNIILESPRRQEKHAGRLLLYVLKLYWNDYISASMIIHIIIVLE